MDIVRVMIVAIVPLTSIFAAVVEDINVDALPSSGLAVLLLRELAGP